jgi:hypothetical protein
MVAYGVETISLNLGFSMAACANVARSCALE